MCGWVVSCLYWTASPYKNGNVCCTCIWCCVYVIVCVVYVCVFYLFFICYWRTTLFGCRVYAAHIHSYTYTSMCLYLHATILYISFICFTFFLFFVEFDIIISGSLLRGEKKRKWMRERKQTNKWTNIRKIINNIIISVM